MNEWTDTCRTCGTSINYEVDAKLFEEINYHLVTIIEDITDMWIENDDTLPDYLCITCKSFLEEIAEFRASCLVTHKKLLEAKKKYNESLTNHDDLYRDISTPDYFYENESNLDNGDLEHEDPLPHFYENESNLDNSDLEHEDPLPQCEAEKPQNTRTSKTSAQAKKTKKPKNIKKAKAKTKTWICEQCGGQFKCSTYLKLHMLRHTGNKEFECDICQNRYYTQNEMNRHRILHTKARPYVCQYCDKTFRGSSSKAVHERTHTNERPFPCQYCDKAFTSTSIRKMHESVHKNNRQYHCEPCDQWFLRSTHLSLHQRTKLHKSRIANN